MPMFAQFSYALMPSVQDGADRRDGSTGADAPPINVEMFGSDLVQVIDSLCRCGRSDLSPMRAHPFTAIGLVRRGCYFCHPEGRDPVLADASTAFLYRGGAAYRSSHPCDGGDARTLFRVREDLLDELLAAAGTGERTSFIVSPATHVAHARLFAAMRSGSPGRMEQEEATLDLLRSVVGAAVSAAMDGARAQVRAYVERARAALNADLQRNQGLDEVAAAAGCSPFHLMRLFRRETGESLRGYRLRLRLLAAFDRMVQGEDDLTALALDTGFSSHSHFTAAFRKLLGATPSQVRATWSGGAVQQAAMALAAGAGQGH